jgi:hypothetical protein
MQEMPKRESVKVNQWYNSVQYNSKTHNSKMKQKLFLMLGLGAMMLSSCSDSFDAPEMSSPTSNKLQISAEIEGMTRSRAINNQWEDGDDISVYSDDLLSNVKFVTTGDGQFKPEDGGDIYFTDSETHHITACYPYHSGDTYTFTVNHTDPTPEGQRAQDILFAEGDASISNPNLNLVFKHKLARLIINVKTSTEHGFQKEDVFGTAEGSTITKSQGQLANLVSFMTLRPKTGEITTNTLKLSPKMQKSIDNYETGVRQYVILVPEQKAVEYRHLFNDGSSNSLTFKTSLGDKTWKAGYSYTYNITVKNTGMTVTSETMEEWGDGGVENFDAE